MLRSEKELLARDAKRVVFSQAIAGREKSGLSHLN